MKGSEPLLLGASLPVPTLHPGSAPPKPAPGCNPLVSLSPFRSSVTTWFAEKGRDYPWRHTRDPYRILVSELLLQQTRIDTVLKGRFYENWIERFPDVESLAAAPEDELLKAWEGLGYYRRARHLQAAARAVIDRHDGVFPRTWREIRALPGVGNYTAGAVLAFAYDAPAAMVDGNVARILARLFDYREPVDGGKGRRQLEEWSLLLVDPENARAFQGGLMELGQTVCSARNPDCDRCPVAVYCQTPSPASLPVKQSRVEIERVDEWVWWMREGNLFYLEREEGARRKGLWRLPQAAAASRAGGDVILQIRYSITRYQVTMRVLRATERDRAGGEAGTWFREEDLDRLALASPDRRAVRRLLELERDGDLWMAGPCAVA